MRRKQEPELKPVLEPATAEQALERISNGESLRQVAANMGLSSEARIREWADNSPENAAQYARAMDRRADHHAGRIERVVDQVEAKELAPDQARVMVDALKWTASKLAPKRYGDKLQVDQDTTLRVVVEDPTRVVRQVAGPAALQVATSVATLIAKEDPSA